MYVFFAIFVVFVFYLYKFRIRIEGFAHSDRLMYVVKILTVRFSDPSSGAHEHVHMFFPLLLACQEANESIYQESEG